MDSKVFHEKKAPLSPKGPQKCNCFLENIEFFFLFWSFVIKYRYSNSHTLPIKQKKEKFDQNVSQKLPVYIFGTLS